MAAGYKTGGRRLGTPNKRTDDLAARLKALKCDPVGGLVSLATDPATEPALKARCFIELLAYLHPKRKAVEVSVEPPKPPDTALTRYDRAIAEIEQIKREIKKYIEQLEAVPDVEEPSAEADTLSR